MLAIDITLRSIDTVPFIAENISALGIDFAGLQTAYISIRNADFNSASSSSSSSLKRDRITLTSINFGRGSFAIIKESGNIIAAIFESTISVAVTAVGRNDESHLSEYAFGTAQNISVKNHTKEKILDPAPGDDIIDLVGDKILSQKIGVFGGAAIVAFYPEIMVELIHSVGVGSSAGRITFSISIIDITKVSKSKIIGATGRIVQNLTTMNDKDEHDSKNDERNSFDIQRFLNQKKNSQSLTEEYSFEEASENSSVCPPIVAVIDEKLESSDSEDSVSINNFLASLDKKKEMIEENPIKTNTLFTPTNLSYFKYNIIERKSREKFLSSGKRGIMAIRNSGDDTGDWPPLAVTQNGITVLGVQEHRNGQKEGRGLGRGVKDRLLESALNTDTDTVLNLNGKDSSHREMRDDGREMITRNKNKEKKVPRKIYQYDINGKRELMIQNRLIPKRRISGSGPISVKSFYEKNMLESKNNNKNIKNDKNNNNNNNDNDNIIKNRIKNKNLNKNVNENKNESKNENENKNEIENEKEDVEERNTNKKKISSSDFWLSNAINDTIDMRVKTNANTNTPMCTGEDLKNIIDVEKDMFSEEPDLMDGILLLASEQKLKSSSVKIIMSKNEDVKHSLHIKKKENEKDEVKEEGKMMESTQAVKILNENEILSRLDTYVDMNIDIGTDIGTEKNQSHTDRQDREIKGSENEKEEEKDDRGEEYGDKEKEDYENLHNLKSVDLTTNAEALDFKPVDVDVKPVDGDVKPVAGNKDDLLDTVSLEILSTNIHSPADKVGIRNLSSTSSSTSTPASVPSSVTEQEPRKEFIAERGAVHSTQVKVKSGSRIIPKLFSFQF